MPEIAEVRTVARTLNKRIVGKKIIGIDLIYDKLIVGDKEKFKEVITNKAFENVTSFGKWLIFNLGEYSFISHLRMEGKYFVKPTSEELAKHEHIIFHLDDGYDLRYHDTRKFGRMKLVLTKDIYNEEEIAKLGIEPDSESLNKKYIFDKIHKSNLPIKTLLLDQTIINGLGNIYVDEVLFKAGINPLKSGKEITLDECDKIKKSGKEIITKATECGGTTIRSYTSSLGVIGNYQEHLMVHTKAGEKCSKCGSTILKTRINGRSSYYCPKCQIK